MAAVRANRQKQARPRPEVRSGEPGKPIRWGRSLAWFLLLLAALLPLWRLVLLDPMLALSRAMVEVPAGVVGGRGSAELITVSGEGDWIVHAPVLFTAREVTRQTALKEPGVRIPRAALQFFSLSFPIFWALALAVERGRRLGRVAGIGTLALAVVSQVSLLLFVADWINRYYVVAASEWGTSLLNVAGYCATGVIPYAAPLAAIIFLDENLRARLLGESTTQISPSRGS